MRQRWERLTFLHWPFEAAHVQRLLPGGLEIETFDGAAGAIEVAVGPAAVSVRAVLRAAASVTSCFATAAPSPHCS